MDDGWRRLRVTKEFMVEITIPCLVATIQVMRRQADLERAQLKAMSEDDRNAPGLSLSVRDLEKALDELHAAYERARLEGWSLPPINTLLP